MLTKEQFDGLNDLYRRIPTRTTRKVIKHLLELPVNNWQPWRREDRLARRMAAAATIAELAEDGLVATVSGGRDCDGFEVRGEVDVMPATVVEYERWFNRFCDGAEGPIWHNLERPSVAEGIERSTRDVFAEAEGY